MKRKTTKEFKQQMHEISPDLIILGEYINRVTPIQCQCKVCQHTWNPLPGNLLQGKKCPRCKAIKNGNSRRKDFKSFIELANELHYNKYDYSKSIYINNFTQIAIICPIHGEFLQIPYVHLRGCGCPKCNQSKGEILVENLLKKYGIYYESQFEVNLGTRKAYIDFFLPEHNIFIEYNGLQHYIPVKHFGGEIRFQEQLSRDNLLREYCSSNSINLIEIKYGSSEECIENILKQYDK